MILTVSEAEAGQKILQFLERHIDLDPSLGFSGTTLHKWIRTGQVRRNKKRVKAFDRLDAFDEIRLPPFANLKEFNRESGSQESNIDLIKNMIIADYPEFMVLNKPKGLAVQGGSKIDTCLVDILNSTYAKSPFKPTPVHRLDRETSGIVLVAKTYGFLRKMHDVFSQREEGFLHKEYLAWVKADVSTDIVELKDTLKKSIENNFERMAIDDKGKVASLELKCISKNQEFSLLQIKLHSGKKHQIRAQLSLHGMPIIGDKKYDGLACEAGLLLHASRLMFDDFVFECLPPWSEPWQVLKLKTPLKSLKY